MSQAEFAEAIGVKNGSLAAWETDRAQPRNVIAVARRIELLTNIPAVWILGLDDGGPAFPPLGGKPLDKPTDLRTTLRRPATITPLRNVG